MHAGLYAQNTSRASSSTAVKTCGTLTPLWLAIVLITGNTARTADESTHLLTLAGSFSHQAVIYSRNKFMIKFNIQYKSA